MAQDLLHGAGVGTAGTLLRKRKKENIREPETQIMQPDKFEVSKPRRTGAESRYLLNPSKIDDLAAETVQMMSPFQKGKRTRGAPYTSKVDKVDAGIPEDHPLKGYAHDLRAGYTKALSDPALKDVPVKELLTEVPKFIAKEGKYAQKDVPSLTDKIHEYKFKKDSAATNLFGLFGGDDSIRALPGFEKYKEKRRAEAAQSPDATTFGTELASTAVGHAAVGAIAKRTAIRAGLRTVISGGLKAAAAQALLPVPGSRVTAAITLGATALMMIPEAYLMSKAINTIDKSDFGITAGGWSKFAANFGIGMGIGTAGAKTAGKLAGKIVGKEAAGKLAAGTSAFNTAQKNVRTARSELNAAKKAFKKNPASEEAKQAVETAKQNVTDSLDTLKNITKDHNEPIIEFGKSRPYSDTKRGNMRYGLNRLSGPHQIFQPPKAATVEKVATAEKALKPLTVATATSLAAGEEVMQNPTAHKLVDFINIDKARKTAASKYAQTVKEFTKEDSLEVLKPKLAKTDNVDFPAWQHYFKNGTNEEIENLFKTMEQPDGMKAATARVNTKQLQIEHKPAEDIWQSFIARESSTGSLGSQKSYRSTKFKEAQAAEELRQLKLKTQAPDGSVMITPYTEFAKNAIKNDAELLNFGGTPKIVPTKTPKTSTGAGLSKELEKTVDPYSNIQQQGLMSPKSTTGILNIEDDVTEDVTGLLGDKSGAISATGRTVDWESMSNVKNKSLPGIKPTQKLDMTAEREQLVDDLIEEIKLTPSSKGAMNAYAKFGSEIQYMLTKKSALTIAKDLLPESAWKGKTLNELKKNIDSYYHRFDDMKNTMELPKDIENVATKVRNKAIKTSIRKKARDTDTAKFNDIIEEAETGTLKGLPTTHKTYSKVKTTNNFAIAAIEGNVDDIIKTWEDGKNLNRITKSNLQDIYRGIRKNLLPDQQLSAQTTKSVLIQNIEDGISTLKGISPKIGQPQKNTLPSTNPIDPAEQANKIIDTAIRQRTVTDIANRSKAIVDEVVTKPKISNNGWYCSVRNLDDIIQEEATVVLSQLSKDNIKGEDLHKIVTPLSSTIPISAFLGFAKDAASAVIGDIKSGLQSAKTAAGIAKEAIPAVSKEIYDGSITALQAHAIRVKAALKVNGTHTANPAADIEKYEKELLDMAIANNYIHRPVSEGAKKIDVPQMDVMDMARENIMEHGGLPKVVNNVKPFWLNIHKIMSPDGLAQALYKEGTSPIQQIAQGAGAIALNTKNGKTVVNNILKDVIKQDGKDATKVIVDEMSELAATHTKTMRPFEVVEQALERKINIEERLIKSMGHKPTRKQIAASTRLNQEIKELEEKLPGLQKKADEWKEAYDIKIKDLASQFSRTRISLAAEDTADFKHNPWLKGMLSDEELEAVEYIKSLNLDYGERVKMAGTWVNRKGEIKGGGTELIKERPYVHHAWHPSWSKKDFEDALSAQGFDTSVGIKPFSKFFRRSKHSQQLVPDIEYNMHKYVTDAEKRIIWDKFWQNGNPNGWARHANNPHLRRSEVFRTFWDNLKGAAAPEQFSKANIWANRYSGMEVFRLLSVSPSVAFKHLFKNVGTYGTLGPVTAASHLPSSIKGSARIHIAPKVEEIANKLGIKYKVSKQDLDDLTYSWTHQGNFHGTIADLGFERIADTKALGRAFDKGLAKVNHYLSFPVRGIEAFDRFHAMQASMEMAAKRGMTKKQAMYGVYDTILKNSFLGGSLNPPWMKDPKFRSLFLFQNTPFKIAQKRMLVAKRTGKSIGKAVKVLKAWNDEEALAKMAKIEEFVKDGQARFKAGMLLDALKSEKDVFGTPIAAQALREAIIAGGLIGVTGSLMGTDVSGHVSHLPFVHTNKRDVTLNVNPALNAMVDAKGDQDDGFFVTKFLKHYAGKSKGLPLIINKATRISDNDIPLRYLNEDGDEDTAALIRYFFGAPAGGRH